MEEHTNEIVGKVRAACSLCGSIYGYDDADVERDTNPRNLCPRCKAEQAAA